jgi:hypothetical protein
VAVAKRNMQSCVSEKFWAIDVGLHAHHGCASAYDDNLLMRSIVYRIYTICYVCALHASDVLLLTIMLLATVCAILYLYFKFAWRMMIVFPAGRVTCCWTEVE